MALRRALAALACRASGRAADARCLATVAQAAPWAPGSSGGSGSSGALPTRRGPGASALLQLQRAAQPAGQHAPWQLGQVRGMFIQTQPTPNPQSLMFLPGRQVMESGSYEFASARAAMVSPLAKKLFLVDGVTGVFFGSDFVTVTKRDELSWPVLKPDIFAAIMDHFSSGEPLFSDKEALEASDTAIRDDDDEVVAMIKELLETRIRPAVQEDGGDIVYKGFDADSGTVTLKMMGACSGCPSSAVTLKSGIENMLMHYIPEVKQVVEAPPDEGEEEGIKAFEQLEKQLST
ncbi:NIFU5 [Scenedesmus sp. PABB004]|nr:NIFU5 [Scenedesmus sp. PABB004]